MTKSVRNSVAFTAVAVVVLGGLTAIQLQRSPMRPLRRPRGVTVIRHPAAQPPRAGKESSLNVAPLATVTVSSTAESGQAGEGVADGVVDRNDWIAESETSGAWIKLSWDKPASIHEIDLFDLPDPDNNVVSGVLTFDDGSSLVVDALPPTGAARRVIFPSKVVRSVMFRIEQAQGPQAGLAEIMVMGTVGR